MREVTEWHSGKIGERTVKALEKNGFKAFYFAQKSQALNHILSLIPPKASVGVGGSATIKDLGITPMLEDNTILDHNNPELTQEEKMDIRLKQQTCDVFLTGSNAVTLDGKLVNMDGIGNRVSAMIFGPKKVIVVIGINKITANLDQAITRIENIASPMNNKRLSLPNPCVEKGTCQNCQSSSRICNVLTIIHKKPLLTDMEIVIIGEDLGY